MVFRSPTWFGTDLHYCLIVTCRPVGGFRSNGVRIALAQKDRSVIDVQFKSSRKHLVSLRRLFVLMRGTANDHFDRFVVAWMFGCRLNFADEVHPATVDVVATFAGI
jgi:hypothetical protein